MTFLPVARPTTPAPIRLLRLLSAVQTGAGLLMSGGLAFFTLLGLGYSTDGGHGPDRSAVELAVGLFATAAVLFGLSVAVPVLTGALRAGATGVHVALLVVEIVAVTTGFVLGVVAGQEALGRLWLVPGLYALGGLGVIMLLAHPDVRSFTRSTGPR